MLEARRVDNFDGDEAQIHLLWLAIANSFVVDYLMRVRMSTTINSFHWHQIPFPRLPPTSPQAIELIEAATQLSMGGPQPRTFSEDTSYRLDTMNLPVSPNDKDLERWKCQYIRAAIDARVADLYGLPTLEYAFILSTFLCWIGSNLPFRKIWGNTANHAITNPRPCFADLLPTCGCRATYRYRGRIW